MCQLCKTKPVYEFTNKRKLCARCFIRYFQKKVLYTIRKFNMINKNDIIGYEKSKDFRSVVLEDILKLFAKKWMIKLVKSHSQFHGTDKKQLTKNSWINRIYKSRAKRDKYPDKITIPLTIDLEAHKSLSRKKMLII